MKKFFIVFILVFMVGAVAGFGSGLQTLDNEASQDDPAVFSVQVVNNESSRETYSIHVSDYYRSRWYSYDNSITLDPGESGNVSLTVNPASGAIAQTYGFEMSVRERSTDEIQRHEGSYRVVQENDLNIVELEKNDSYRPGENVEIDVFFQNVDSSTSEYIDVVFKALGQNHTEELGPIVPGGQRRISTDFEIPEYEAPGDKQLAIEFKDRTHLDGFEVEEVENITENRMRENRFLVVTQNSEITNRGNTPRNYTYTIQKSSYVAPVVNAPGAETMDENGSVIYTWDLSIEPGETQNVEARTDYWIPVTGLALLLAGFLTLKKLTSSVSARKKVSKTSEGLDIKIEIENNSSKTYDDVILEDFIPNIAELDSTFDMASPEIKHTDQGSELKWWIGELSPGDQRIFKYSIRPKIEVEEGITLKSAVLKDGDEALDETKDIETEFRPSE